jgi:Putative esterase
MVVVTPSARRSFYMDYKDGSQKWETFIVTEFLDHLRANYKVTRESKSTLLFGISMGGMGALRIGFKYPEKFARLVAMEPGIDPVLKWKDLQPRNKFWRGQELMETIFGKPFDEAYWEANNVATITVAKAEKLRASGLGIYIEAGDEDAFYLTPLPRCSTKPDTIPPGTLVTFPYPSTLAVVNDIETKRNRPRRWRPACLGLGVGLSRCGRGFDVGLLCAGRCFGVGAFGGISDCASEITGACCAKRSRMISAAAPDDRPIKVGRMVVIIFILVRIFSSPPFSSSTFFQEENGGEENVITVYQRRADGEHNRRPPSS